MCGPNVRLEDIIYDAMQEVEGFNLIPLDRQGEMATEVAAMVTDAMEDIDMHIADEVDVDRATRWVANKAREYVLSELEGWK